MARGVCAIAESCPIVHALKTLATDLIPLMRGMQLWERLQNLLLKRVYETLACNSNSVIAYLHMHVNA